MPSTMYSTVSGLGLEIRAKSAFVAFMVSIPCSIWFHSWFQNTRYGSKHPIWFHEGQNGQSPTACAIGLYALVLLRFRVVMWWS